MSNIAGKAYAMNLVTPVFRWMTGINKLIFGAVGTRPLAFTLRGLQTLSMIHYARWVVIRSSDWPRLNNDQPEEKLNYDYMMFLSNFNGSWAQYVDSFSNAIPSGLNLLWFMNVGWPKSVPQEPFHKYVTDNQIWTDHYYSAYPLAASNDVKSGARVRERLTDFTRDCTELPEEEFALEYNRMMKDLQLDLGTMNASPPLSVSAISAQTNQARQAQQAQSSNHAP